MSVSSQELVRVAKASDNKSTLVGAQGSRPQEQIRDDLVALEYEALSLLLLHWAQPPDGSSRWKERCDKLPLFRAAVMGGMGSGGKEACPAEFVLDEYEVVLEAVHWLKSNCPYRKDPGAIADWLREHHHDYHCILSQGALQRPFPCSAALAEELATTEAGAVKWISSPDPLARKIVAKRLAISVSTVKNKLNEEDDRRWSATPLQRQLASIFLDLSTQPTTPAITRIRAAILNTLFRSEYWLIQIVYLVQASHQHKLGCDICLGSLDEAEILSWCAQADQRDAETRMIGFDPDSHSGDSRGR